MKTTARRPVVLAAAFALLLAGCADDDAETVTDDPTTQPDDETDDETDDGVEDDADDGVEDDGTDDAQDEEAEDAAADGAASVAVDGTDLGNVLVDSEGMTLYLFDADEQGPSQCTDDCEANWPPLVTDGDPVAEGGADESLLGTVERDDGSMQVTYDGWPLYYFIADQQPGDVEGQAVQEVWWVLGADGEPMRDGAAGAEDEEEESDRAGY